MALVGLLAVPAVATASDYSHSAPRFDEITMLRVAMAYNLVGDEESLQFPATSDGACNIAGLGGLTFVGKDHNPWATGPEGAAYRESLRAFLGPHRDNPWCDWLRSDAAEAAVPGISEVWGATLKLNFKRLRRGLRRSNCTTVYESLSRYPEADLPIDRIHRKVTVVMLGPCEKGHPPHPRPRR